jgi:hypothetical protein
MCWDKNWAEEQKQRLRKDQLEEEERLRRSPDEPENIRPNEPVLADELFEDEEQEYARSLR